MPRMAASGCLARRYGWCPRTATGLFDLSGWRAELKNLDDARE